MGKVEWKCVCVIAFGIRYVPSKKSSFPVGIRDYPNILRNTYITISSLQLRTIN